MGPPCASLFRHMPWADKLTDMGTYPMWNKPNPMPADQIMLQECPAPQNQYDQWCGLEGQVLNHIAPLTRTVPAEYAMGAADGQYVHRPCAASLTRQQFWRSTMMPSDPPDPPQVASSTCQHRSARWCE